ncbi:MAG: metalloregulator ArsR/SmtB family transcription factor [Armatimonadetes bacterium]|nr:metalloregulator ArsR/SmtB family transcription factor [Armatimonadota bacterium]
MDRIDIVFKALADPARIRIVEVLSTSDEMCVCNIMKQLGMTQPAVSHHLSVLKNAGLVQSRRQGQWIYYSLCLNMLSDIVLKFIQDLLTRSKVPQEPSECCE